MAKKTIATKLDNDAGVMYEACRRSKIKNPRFKVEFISTLSANKNFGKTVHSLIQNYRKTGELKCACCGADNVYFKFNKEKGRVIFKAYIKKSNKEQLMTVDHDVLKALGGQNNISNYNPMCYDCNALRGSRFAEFKEFKDWYDAKKAGINVSEAEHSNFCFIDYSMNKNNNQFFGNICGATTLPPLLVNAAKKAMRSPKPDVFSFISMKEFIALERNYANALLNELVYERSYKTQNCRDIPMGEHDFFIGCHNSDHRRIKVYIQEQVKEQLSIRMKEQQNILLKKRSQRAQIPVEVKEINTSFTFKSLWVKFTNIFA